MIGTENSLGFASKDVRVILPTWDWQLAIFTFIFGHFWGLEINLATSASLRYSVHIQSWRTPTTPEDYVEEVAILIPRKNTLQVWVYTLVFHVIHAKQTMIGRSKAKANVSVCVISNAFCDLRNRPFRSVEAYAGIRSVRLYYHIL